MPKASILIPLYKPNAKHLQEALESLLSQTEQDFEVIICEEPTDVDALPMLEDVLKDERFQHFKNEQCLGIGGNWNRCFSHASSPIIACLFQDDLWDTDYLESALQIFEQHPRVGFISMNHRYQHDEDLWTKEGYEKLDAIKKEVLHPGVWSGEKFLTMWLKREMHPNLIGEPPFVVLRKEVMEEVGPFNEHMPQFLDVEYWLRCLLKTDWYYEDKLHGAFRIHGQAASFKNNESGQGLYDRLTCYELLISRLSGNLKKLAKQSRKKAVQSMAEKFLNRVEHKKGVSSKGSGQVFKFALRHPLMVASAGVRVLSKRITQIPS